MLACTWKSSATIDGVAIIRERCFLQATLDSLEPEKVRVHISVAATLIRSKALQLQRYAQFTCVQVFTHNQSFIQGGQQQPSATKQRRMRRSALTFVLARAVARSREASLMLWPVRQSVFATAVCKLE